MIKLIKNVKHIISIGKTWSNFLTREALLFPGILKRGLIQARQSPSKRIEMLDKAFTGGRRQRG